MADNEIKIMNIDCPEGGRNPLWGGITHAFSCIGLVFVLLGLALSVKMCNSDIETISKAWYGQLECECSQEDEP